MAITLGGRFGLTRWGAGTDPLRRAQLDANNALLESLAAIYGQGTIAARPAAGTAGRFWIAQGDPTVANGTLYYDNGTAWVQPLAAQQIPSGMFGPTFATVLPAGFLWMVGGVLYNKDAYPGLYAAIGDVAGVSTSTQFGVPDMRGRAPFGLDAFGGAADAGRLNLANTLGLAFGAQLVALTEANLASHAHGASSGYENADHQHGINQHVHATGGTNLPSSGFNPGTTSPGANAAAFNGSYNGHGHGNTGGEVYSGGGPSLSTNGINANHLHAISVAAAGSGTAHENMPPGILCNWIIKT